MVLHAHADENQALGDNLADKCGDLLTFLHGRKFLLDLALEKLKAVPEEPLGIPQTTQPALRGLALREIQLKKIIVVRIELELGCDAQASRVFSAEVAAFQECGSLLVAGRIDASACKTL